MNRYLYMDLGIFPMMSLLTSPRIHCFSHLSRTRLSLDCKVQDFRLLSMCLLKRDLPQ